MDLIIASGSSAEQIMWSLSVMITDFVFLPQLTSISLPAFFASCTNLRTGSDSGETTDITRSPLTKFPNPASINFIILLLFDILYLLANFFYVALGFDNLLCDFAVIAFRADGVYLSVHFLNKKIELSADGDRFLEYLLELREMRIKSCKLLANIRLVGKYRAFGEQSLLVVFRAR